MPDGTTNQVDALHKGQPQAGKEGTPNQPRTYTEKEYKDAIAATGAEWGRKYKTLETEHKTLKETHTSLSSEIDGLRTAAKAITDAGGDAAKLQEQIKALTKRDRDLTARELTMNEREKVIHEADLKTNAAVIASEYEQNDPERLIKACVRAGIKHDDEEGIREMADIIGFTKKEGGQRTPVTTEPADSGNTSGASGVKLAELLKKNPKKMTPSELREYEQDLKRALGR